MSEIEPKAYIVGNDLFWGISVSTEAEARRRGIPPEPLYPKSALAQARAEERERCAKVADDRESQWRRNGYTEAELAASQIASCIRALDDE